MPLRTVQTNFTSGMLDAKVRDHVDLVAYRNGAKLIRNCRQLPQGGITRRSGSAALASLVRDDYLVEAWTFSSTQAYAFLFSDGAVDIWDRFSRTYLTTISGPWTAAHIAANELRVEQQLDKMFVSHADFETQQIVRTGYAAFTIGVFPWATSANGIIVYQPYHKYAPSTATLAVSATAVGPAYVVSSVAYFEIGHVGLKIRYRKKQMTITGVTGPTQADVTIDEALPAAAADYDWDEQAFSPIRGYARSIALHAQRLWIGGGRDCPNVIWGTTLDNPYSVNLGTGADDEAIKYAIYSDRVAEIVSLLSNGFLQIFTTHGEFFVPTPDSQALTPGTFAVLPASRYGSAALAASEFDGTSIFISRKAKGVREFVFDAVQASFAANALTFMAKSLISDPTDLDVQMEGEGEEQECRAYVCNDDGTIAVLSKVQKENIAGWSYWDTQGSFKRLGVIDSEVWAIVERTVNGMAARYLEIFDRNHLMDFSVTDSGAASDTWGPYLLHKGVECHVRSGDLYLGLFTPDPGSGMLVLDRAVTELELGLNFDVRAIPLQQQVQLADGVSVGEPRRYVSMTALLADTLDCRIKNRDLVLPQPDPDVAPERFTGRFRAHLIGWDYSVDVEIASTWPLPFTLNSLVAEVEV